MRPIFFTKVLTLPINTCIIKNMNNIDQILTFLVAQADPPVEKYLSNRDSHVLRSLARIASSPNFITENQGKLVVKILKENSGKIPFFQEEINQLLSNPLWSKSFRKIDTVKKIFIESTPSGEKVITIEFTFSSAIRKILQDLSKNLTGLSASQNGKEYQVDLTEKNIVLLVETLSPHGFEIDEKIKNFYDTIKSWSKSEIFGQFNLTNITHQNFQKHITSDLGLETAIDQNIILDRSIRYQYFYKNQEKEPSTLTEEIAFRKNTRIWVDKNKFTLTEVIASLVSLRRLPLLIVFDAHDPKRNVEDLKILHQSLEKNKIYNGVGVYFRLNNDALGKEFNQYIADNRLNEQLDSSTKVAGVNSGKIPKFLLKTDWKPMSVISLGNQLRHSKTSIYANCCDLIITYADKEPLFEVRTQWE